MSSVLPPRTPPAPLHVLGALALELRGDAPVTRASLAQAEVGDLAALIARDLGKFAPEATSLQLITVGAHYDPVEVLRPGWPLHRELDDLASRAPKEVPLGGAPKEVPLGGPRDGTTLAATGRIIAFGAHDEQLPGALAPSPDFIGGPLRLVPLLLGGDADVIARVGDAFERDLLERGMAGA
ncbi:MAG: hypothetical protein ACREPE_12215, partial [Lysobacter sp.]